MTPIDMLLDENNNDPIVLFNEHGEEIAFEQIALIPLDGGIYALLRPIAPMEGVGEDEAIVFTIVVEDDEPILVVVEDDATVDAVFAVYYDLLKDAGVN